MIQTSHQLPDDGKRRDPRKKVSKTLEFEVRSAITIHQRVDMHASGGQRGKGSGDA